MQLQDVINIAMSVYRSVLFSYYAIALKSYCDVKVKQKISLAEYATKTQHRRIPSAPAN